MYPRMHNRLIRTELPHGLRGGREGSCFLFHERGSIDEKMVRMEIYLPDSGTGRIPQSSYEPGP